MSGYFRPDEYWRSDDEPPRRSRRRKAVAWVGCLLIGAVSWVCLLAGVAWWAR